MRQIKKRYASGLSLIELMAVVLIISILAVIAYPAYQQYAQRSNRTDATVALSEASQRLERCFTTFNRYDHANCSAIADLDAGVGLISQARFYRITGVFAANSYTLTARPILTPQTTDAACPLITLDNTGARTPAACW